jgi:hypothetical protein
MFACSVSFRLKSDRVAPFTKWIKDETFPLRQKLKVLTIVPVLAILSVSSAGGQSLGDPFKQGIKIALPDVRMDPANTGEQPSAAPAARTSVPSEFGDTPASKKATPAAAAPGSPSQSSTKGPFTVNHVIQFTPGTERQRAALKRIPAVRDIVDGDFRTASEDLNDDGEKELIVMSQSQLWCGSGGCATVVLQKRPNGIAIIFEQSMFGDLAVTNEKIGSYHALAVPDGQGGIVIGDKRGTPMYGKQLVYPMNSH